MRKLLFAIYLLPALLVAQGTDPLSFQLFRISEEIQLKQQSTTIDAEVHLLLKGEKTAIEQFLTEQKGRIKYTSNNIFAVRLPATAIPLLPTIPGLQKAEIHSRSLYFDDLKAREYTAVDTVHAGGGLLQDSYTGKGVVLGVIDSGIDPTHPDFKNDDGSTRILGFWDQVDTLYSLAPYGYGKEYTNTDIDNGEMNNYMDTTFNGHGTAVTGMAAGSGRAHENIKGMAPEADIVVVGINPQILDYLDRTPAMLAIVDGIHYIFSIADEMGLPAVINISLGGIEGSHDGKDLPTRMIEGMLDEKPGRALVVSAGNSGTAKLHLGLEVQQDTVFTWFESMYANSSVCQRDSGAYMSFYGDSLDVINLRYNIGAEDRSPCCSTFDETGFRPFIQPIGQLLVDTLKDGNTTIGILTTFVEKIEDTYAFFMEIKSSEMDMLWRFSLTGEGRIDGWAGPLTARSCNSTYINNENAIGNSSQIPGPGSYVRPDRDQTIGNAYVCSDKIIAVGAYMVNKTMLDVDSITRTYSGNPQARASFSSRGPSRNNRIKPDISGPGSRIITPQASQVLSDKLVNARSTLYLGGMHSITDGTSFSSPAVAGIVALYFEKYPNATYADVKEAMISTAYQDNLTGTDMPNNLNGYGRINAYQMLLTSGPAEIPTVLEGLVFPNPSTAGSIFLNLPIEWQNRSIDVSFYDVRGRLVQQSNEQGNTLEIQTPGAGFYVLKVSDNSGNSFFSKIIVQ